MGFLVLIQGSTLSNIWVDAEIHLHLLEPNSPNWHEVWQWIYKHIEEQSQPLNQLTGTIERILEGAG